MTVGAPDLRTFLRLLRERGDLVEVDVPVDTRLEMTEIACRLVRAGGPAVLFKRPVVAATPGSPSRETTIPVLLNALGTDARMALALGRAPSAIAQELQAFIADAVPPRPSVLWRHRRLLWRATRMGVRTMATGPCKEVVEAPDLGKLPVLTCWPEDAGPFITWPMVVTRHPEHGDDNLGLYRMQVHGPAETGMHWQIGKGGAFHHAAAERRGRDLPCAVALGGEPLTLFAAMMPLPEGISELAFAGFLRGRPTRVVRTASGLPVPADSEIVLEGVVPAGVRRLEGPFGDHFGHYSHAADFPVFRIERMWRRRHPIYVAAVVGKPPQEDMVLGNAVQEMFLPLLKATRPEVRDAWAHYETGFHSLLTVSMRPRYEKESLKTAFSLLGEGQVSLTKACLVVPHDVDCRDARAVLGLLATRFRPERDVLVLPETSADTLDFTGPRLNRGSKLVIDLTGPPVERDSLGTLPDLASRHAEILDQTMVVHGVLVVRVREGRPGRPVLERLVQDPGLERMPLIVAVSSDVDPRDPVSWLWGWFTRFDPATDILFRSTTLRGPVAVHEGTMAIDATWKPGYPRPLVMPEEIVQRVDARWREYRFR